MSVSRTPPSAGDLPSVVAPALAGNVELLGDVAGGLVQPRDDVAGYVSALAGLRETLRAFKRGGSQGPQQRSIGQFPVHFHALTDERTPRWLGLFAIGASARGDA